MPRFTALGGKPALSGRRGRLVSAGLILLVSLLLVAGKRPFADGQESVLSQIFPAGTPRDARSRKMAIFMAASLERASQLAAALDKTSSEEP